METLTTALMADLRHHLHLAWQNSKGELTPELMRAVTSFPYYLIAGCETQTNLEAVAVDRHGNYFAYTIGSGDEQGFVESQGNLNMDVPNFNATLETVAEIFAQESLQRFRMAA